MPRVLPASILLDCAESPQKLVNRVEHELVTAATVAAAQQHHDRYLPLTQLLDDVQVPLLHVLGRNVQQTQRVSFVNVSASVVNGQSDGIRLADRIQESWQLIL